MFHHEYQAQMHTLDMYFYGLSIMEKILLTNQRPMMLKIHIELYGTL
jgi:hypothetical protein